MKKNVRYSLTYRRTRLYFSENPRTGKCLFDDGAKVTNLHHWAFRYPTKQVKKNPSLAKENAVELCLRHHELANAMRKIAEAFDGDLLRLMKTMDKQTVEAFIPNISLLLSYYNLFGQGSNIVTN